MNFFRFLALAAVAVMAGGFGAGAATRTVEHPWINFANTTALDIAGVEMNDSATVLSFDVYYPPKYWIKISPGTYLQADGKKYALKGTEGITPGAPFWMPESGQANFKLFFEPMPREVEAFDFIEGDDADSFKLWDVQLAGNGGESQFPASLMGPIKDGSLPAPKLEQGRTTINFHIVPFNSAIPCDMTVHVNTIADSQDEYQVKIDAEGNGTLSFDQYGPASVIVTPDMGRISAKIRLQPGETVDCYLDMRMTGLQVMFRRADFPVEKFQRVAHTGVYGDLDRMMDVRGSRYRLNLYSGTFADYRMSGQEYKNMVKGLYEAMRDSIASSDEPNLRKEYELLELQNDVLEAAARFEFLLGHNYRERHDSWNPMTPVPEDSIPGRLTPEDYREMAGWFDMTNPNLLLAGSHIGDMDWGEYGVKGDLSKSINLYSEMAAKAAENKLQQEDLDSLKALSNPFFAAACDSICQRTQRVLSRLSTGTAVSPTPEVAPEQIFDAIVAPYKGKVVVVDLWNTWCGPCRAALKHHEPLKTAGLASEDIVWIYIADESSDPVKYLQLVPEIKGVHYKLSEEQIRAIGKRFKVDGIPYYILVDREGNAEGRPDMRYDGTFVNAIKSKL